MKSQFNEFTYAYAVTYDIIQNMQTDLTSAPFIPSLYDEGKTGGGWDVKLSRPGYPLYLQYKIADQLGKRGRLWKQFDHDYFRFKIWKSAKSNQQDLLIDLERSGEEIYYVAPFFAKNDDLNHYYLNGLISSNSIYVKPSAIGTLPDNKEHYWAYDGQGMQFFCSTPELRETDTSFATWMKLLRPLNASVSLEASLIRSVANLSEAVTKIDDSGLINQLVSNRPFEVQVEILARSLGCGTIILTSPDETSEE